MEGMDLPFYPNGTNVIDGGSPSIRPIARWLQTAEETVMNLLKKAILALGFVGAMVIGTPNLASAQGVYFSGPGFAFGVGHPWYGHRYYWHHPYYRPYGYYRPWRYRHYYEDWD